MRCPLIAAVAAAATAQVGAGTMNPATFLRVLGPEPWNVAYAEPSVRPDDSRYGDNPNRVQRHTQFQARSWDAGGSVSLVYVCVFSSRTPCMTRAECVFPSSLHASGLEACTAACAAPHSLPVCAMAQTQPATLFCAGHPEARSG